LASTGILSTDLETRLAARTLELIDIPSSSRAERDIARHVLGALRHAGVPARDAGDTCVLAGALHRSERPLLLLAGHLDTVPAQGNLPGVIAGEHVVGLGASDMKGGIAVMLEHALAHAGGRAGRVEAHDCGRGALGASRIDVGYVFFGREELPSTQGALAPLLARERGLRTADLAIVLEPTSCGVQAGCLGNLDATWTFRGRSGHSARPWLADSAIEHAAAGVHALAALQPSRRSIAGLQFTQVASVTTLHAGVARNVIPAEAQANVNFRYFPDMSPQQAEATVRGWCSPHGELDILANSAGALPPQGNSLMELLTDASERPVQGKQAWTPVAEFAAAGIEAVNFGPGDPAFAHHFDERVATAALAHCHQVLERVLCA
jgi:succinyl-diaminopimelate desuccinylase